MEEEGRRSYDSKNGERCNVAGFEDEDGGNKSRNGGGFEKWEKTKLIRDARNIVLLMHFYWSNETHVGFLNY